MTKAQVFQTSVGAGVEGHIQGQAEEQVPRQSQEIQKKAWQKVW